MVEASSKLLSPQTSTNQELIGEKYNLHVELMTRELASMELL
jgi:hypothetical protein